MIGKKKLNNTKIKKINYNSNLNNLTNVESNNENENNNNNNESFNVKL